MAKVKQRGADTAQKSVKEETSVKRMANVGTKVKLSTGKEVTLKEPSAEELLSDIMPILEDIQGMQLDNLTSDMSGLAQLLKDEKTRKVIKHIAATLTKESPEVFDELKIKDWLALITAAKNEIDIEEYKNYFTELGLGKA